MQSTQVPDQKILEWMIVQIEKYCTSRDIDHRFVGGVSYGGLLNGRTTYTVDARTRRVQLAHHNPLELLRSDRSVRDIDFIICTYEPHKYADLRRFLNRLKWQVRLKLSYTPAISYESVLPSSARAHGVMNYVTTLRVNDGGYELRFDRVRQPISSDSLQPWHVTLEDGTTYTTRNPLADYYAYQFRSPAGVKPKDLKKLSHLRRLADEVIRQGARHHIDYNDDRYYRSWETYIHRLNTSQEPSVRLKRHLTHLYWSSIGTSLAHGRGIIGKPVFVLYNFFTRLTQ